MRSRGVLALIVLPLVFAAWTSATGTPPRACSAQEAASPRLVSRGGYNLACGPGSALVRVEGAVARVNHSKCFSGARLYFGQAIGVPPRPMNGLYLVIEPSLKAGVVGVIDGGIRVTTAKGTRLAGAISGKARVDVSLKSGTFVITGRSGSANGWRFTGNWVCG